jgi:hypothetical protein
VLALEEAGMSSALPPVMMNRVGKSVGIGCSVLVVGVLGAVGCAPTEEEADVEVSDSSLVGLATVALPDHRTHATGLSLFQGYSPLFEQSTDVRCVSPTPGQETRVKVTGVTSRLDYVLVSSREQLAKELGIDLDLKIKYAVGSINPTLSLVEGFKDEARSVFVLVTASHRYRVSRADGLAIDITPDAAEAASDPSSFLPRCGSHFIDGITYGAQTLLGLRFDVDTLAAANEIKGGLGLGVGAGPVGVDAAFGAKLKQALERSGAAVELSVASEGYLIEKDGRQVDPTADVVKALLGGTFDEHTVTGLHGLVTSMADSVRTDMCRDAPSGVGCSGGPGYLANDSRRSVIMSVDLRPYHSLAGAPRGTPWLRINDALKRTDDTLRALAPLAARIAEAHAREVKPFLEADPAQQSRFGLAAATRVDDTPGLVARATEWDRRLRPLAGTDLRPLEDLVERCFSAATAGVFDACDPASVTGPEYARAEAALRTYRAEGRILPLRYTPIAPMSLAAATSECTTRLKMRLPSRAEVSQMAVAVRRAPDLPAGGELARTVWYAGEPNHCTAFYNPPGAGNGVSLDRCTDDHRMPTRLPAFCVPKDGPFARQ